MTIGKIGKRKVISAPIEATIFEVAKLMKQHNIGDVIIVENKNEPVGIITDRDIVIKIVADEVNPKEMIASDMMSNDLLILKEYQNIQEAIDMMCARGVRRAPIVNVNNILIGLVSTDDLALLISDEMESYAKLIRKQLSII